MKIRKGEKCTIPIGLYIFHFLCVGTALFSRAASSQVFSALTSLTSVFGMGTGGPPPLLAPTTVVRFFAEAYIKQVALIYTIIHFFKNGDPYEIRTRVAGVRGRSLRPLDQRAILCAFRPFAPLQHTTVWL